MLLWVETRLALLGFSSFFPQKLWIETKLLRIAVYLAVFKIYEKVLIELYFHLEQGFVSMQIENKSIAQIYLQNFQSLTFGSQRCRLIVHPIQHTQ